MDTNKMREQVESQFEAFFAEYEKKREANGWMPLEAHVLVHMRNAWIASREAVVVELTIRPNACEEEQERMTDYEIGLGHGGCEEWDKIRGKIKAQGLKATP